MITVYTKPNCGGCELTKQWLDRNNIPYDTIDVTDHPTAVTTIQSHGYQSLPVVTIDGFSNSWTGYNESRLAELLEGTQ